MDYFFQDFPRKSNLGDGSPVGSGLFLFVLGMGVTVLIPYALGKIPCWRHVLYM